MVDASQGQAIAVSAPDLGELEREYLLRAFDSSWISSTGPFVDRFEQEFAAFAAVPHALSCVNGTAALHLALLGLGVGPGDEVIVPSLTYVATANAVRYVGAEPVFADCDSHTWTMDAESVVRLIGRRTRAIVPVHLFGNPAGMNELRSLAAEHGLCLIEDASEAHGARLGGTPVGGLGHVATFSFYGNKILATGEGGMVCTADRRLADRIRRLRGQGADPSRPYWFDSIGYNYRMTNLACAIGVAQLSRFEELRRAREAVRGWYEGAIATRGVPILSQRGSAGAEPVLWMCGVVLRNGSREDRDRIRAVLLESGIETRPFFTALHTLPMFRTCRRDGACEISRRLGERGIMLPTHSKLGREEVERVVRCLGEAISAGTVVRAGAGAARS